MGFIYFQVWLKAASWWEYAFFAISVLLFFFISFCWVMAAKEIWDDPNRKNADDAGYGILTFTVLSLCIPISTKFMPQQPLFQWFMIIAFCCCVLRCLVSFYSYTWDKDFRIVIMYATLLSPAFLTLNYSIDAQEQYVYEQALAPYQQEARKAAKEEKLRETQAQLKLAELRAAKTEDGSSQAEIAQLQEKIQRIKTHGTEEPQLTSSQGSSEPIGQRTKLILSALWLGAAFFLQRIFEKFAKDKGYALLGVCAIGFLIAFLTANYFLLGGSVTGGIIGSMGERG